MSAQPNDLANNLLKKLHQLGVGDLDVNDIVLRSIENDAKKLQSLDPVNALVIKAGVSYFQHKTQDMLKYHKCALDISPYDYIANMNYAISLGNTGRYREAFEIMRDFAQSNEIRDDISIFSHLCNYAHSAGMFSDADRYAEKLTRLNSEAKYHDSIKASVEMIKQLRLQEHDIKEYFSAVTEVLTSHDVYPHSEASWFTEDNEIIREVFIATDPDKAASMNRELSEAVAQMDLPTDLLMSFYCLFTTEKE